MSRFAQLAVLLATALFVGLSPPAHAQPRVLDTLDSPEGWKVITSDAVSLDVVPDSGPSGKALRLNYHFRSGTGYAIIQKPFAIAMPENYEFSFRLRGQGPPNNLEFKLLDASGENVWWQIRRAYDWPKDWTRLVIKKRDIEFAWGPAAGAPLTQLAKIEFAISSNSGGKGSIWIDELTFRALPLPRATPTILKPASTNQDASAALALDIDPDTVWTPAPGFEPELIIDQGEAAEFGGVDIRWSTPPATFSLAISDDQDSWTPIAESRPPGISTTVVPTPNAQARYLRISTVPKQGQSVGIHTLSLRPVEFSTSTNAMLASLARERRRGILPRQFFNEQSYWTVIGADDGQSEALINEEGMIEVGKRSFSIEPFITRDGTLLTWADGTHAQSLRDGYLPIPTVVRKHDGVELSIAPFASGDASTSTLYALYTLTNTSTKQLRVNLHLAIRPFQVNPPWQRLNFEGGASRISTISATLGRAPSLIVNSDRRVTVLTPGARLAASTWAQGGVLDWLATKQRPPTTAASCPDGLASGLFTYDTTLEPGRSQTFILATPLEGEPAQLPAGDQAETAVLRELDRVSAAWHDRLSRASITVPTKDQWLADSFKAQVAYILINRDGPAIQPGSRSYERSWARDGSLTSAALLACGHPEEVRAWIDWFGAHLFENGKVPCVVDTRGPDPVPEHDSHGQYIWAVANYWRHTHDQAFLELHWPRVQKVVAYIQSLRSQRMTDEYKTDAWPASGCYGLVPESISHEGYSAKPMHSYWDDFFVLLGLNEAASLAGAMGDTQLEQQYRALAIDFHDCLVQSIHKTQAHAKIDYIPGCVELADFDSTSTTIALFPCAANDAQLMPSLRATFDRYWRNATERMSPDSTWDAYTPYELRHVGAFVRLGEPEKAWSLLNWFHLHQRPQAWHHWAEVVFRDPLTPKFIGDMPHTWVGSDFLNSVISMFMYESGDNLVLFGGIPQAWIDSGEPISFSNLVTPRGPLSGTLQRKDREVHVQLLGSTTTKWPPMLIHAPIGAVEPDAVVRSLPADIVFHLR